MKKVAVLVEDYYQVLEVWYPYLRLREEGIQTVLVGTGKGQYKSKEGYPITSRNPYDLPAFCAQIIKKLNPPGLKSGDSSRAEKAQFHSSHGL